MSYSQAFSQAGQLSINNSSYGMQQRFMSPDGMNYRFSGQANQFPWTREVKLGPKAGTVRFLDTLTNRQAQPQTVAVRVMVQTRSSNAAIVTSGGQTFQGRPYQGVIPPKQVGFVAQTRSTSYMTPIVFLCGPKSQVRPNITNGSSSNQSFQVNYSVTIPPGKSATLLYGFAQHQHLNAPPQAKAVEEMFKPFLAKEFTKDIPKAVRRQIVNWSIGPSTEGSFGPLLEPLTELADAHDVERGPKSILIVGEESQVPGQLSDGSINVGTRLGNAVLTMSQVAGLTGGGGVGRQPRVYLRSGEVLAGAVELADVRFNADSGLQFELDSDHIQVLLTKAEETDGRPAETRTQWLETQFGDRLELRTDDDSTVNGVSMWGPVQVPLSLVKVLARNQEGLPVHRMELQDGSKLWLILQGNSLETASKTLGAVNVPVAVIDRIGTVEPPPKEEEEEAEDKPASNNSATATANRPTPAPAAPTQTQRSIPKITLPPPDSLTEQFRQSLTKSLASTTKILEQVEKDLTEKPGDAELTNRRFDMLYQVASLEARLGKYADALKKIKTAKSLKGLDARRSSRLAYLQGLEAAVSERIPATPEEPEEAPGEEPPAEETPEANKSPDGDNSEEDEPGEEEPAPTPPARVIVNMWTLEDENKANASFRDETVDFLAATGETAIQAADIRAIKRQGDEQGRTSFLVELKDGSRVSGRFKSAVLGLQFYGQAWNMPVRHVKEYKWSDAAASKDEDAEDE